MYICSNRLCETLSSLCGSSKLQLYLGSIYITNPYVITFSVFMAQCVFPCGESKGITESKIFGNFIFSRETMRVGGVVSVRV